MFCTSAHTTPEARRRQLRDWARRSAGLLKGLYAVASASSAAGDTSFADYVFGYDSEHESIPLGYCALYNHSQDPNVEAETDTNANTVVMKALRDIAPGEQLFMKYEDGYFDERGKVMV